MKVTILIEDMPDGSVNFFVDKEETGINDIDSKADGLGKALMSRIDYAKSISISRREVWYDRVGTGAIGACFVLALFVVLHLAEKLLKWAAQ